MQLSFTQLTIDYYPYHKAGLYNNFFKRRKSCFYLFIYLFIYLVFLGPHPWHMEVPRLGAELEL